MNLNILWFILVAVLFCVYFFLDGMDFGVGMLIPFLGKNDKDNRKMIHTIGPTWGASEVWLLTAGGAMFATFPGWYATMFSGFYPAIFLLALALILRGVSIEFRGKVMKDSQKKAFNICIGVGNLMIPLLLGVAIACLLRGVPINESFEYTGTLFTLFSPFTLLAGLATVSFFLFHGAVYLKLKLSDEIKKTDELAKKTGLITIVLLFLTLIVSYFETDIFVKPVSIIFAVISFALLVIAYIFYLKKPGILVLVFNALVIATVLITVFSAMFPRVMVSSTDNNYSLTIYNASSSNYTLTVITFITITLLPIVLGYTLWSHWLFAKKNLEDIEY